MTLVVSLKSFVTTSASKNHPSPQPPKKSKGNRKKEGIGQLAGRKTRIGMMKVMSKAGTSDRLPYLMFSWCSYFKLYRASGIGLNDSANNS